MLKHVTRLDQVGWLAWSPDGTKIASQSCRDWNTEVHVMNSHGVGQTRLTSNGECGQVPCLDRVAVDSGLRLT